jgi:hypothetical protein
MAGADGRQATWEIIPAGRSPAVGALLRIGERAIPVGDIRGFVGSCDGGRDRGPALATLIVFGAAALVFLVGVVEIGWRPRMLAATVVLGAIGATALNDLTWLTQSVFYRVEILTGNGVERFTTADEGEQMRLMETLRRIVGCRAAADGAIGAAPTAAMDVAAA